jgi:hypothetical protein
MDCSYCNGDVGGGSRKKTPYVVGIFALLPQIAHAMQQPRGSRVRKWEDEENRESTISLAQRAAGGNEESGSSGPAPIASHPGRGQALRMPQNLA